MMAFSAVSFHELAHYAVARLAGAKEVKVTLMPYGASMRLEGETPHLGAILIAGPFCNLTLAAFLLSACWITPELYGFFKGFIGANVMIATLNLLPAYPLDGGRLVRLLFKGKWRFLFTDLCTLGLGVMWLWFFLLDHNAAHLVFSCFMLSYFFAFCVKRPILVKGSDPLFALVKTDEDGRLRSVYVGRGKSRQKLKPHQITRLCLKYPREMRVGEALLAESGNVG